MTRIVRTTLVVVSLPAAALLTMTALTTAAATAGSAAPTCDGRPATIVGSPGGVVTGTAGDDVIVTAGAARVDALAGSDLVCVTGDAEGVTVLAGEGDDQVLSVDGPHEVSAELGPGRDRFVGGDGPDSVVGGSYADGVPQGDADVDTLDTGGGETRSSASSVPARPPSPTSSGWVPERTGCSSPVGCRRAGSGSTEGRGSTSCTCPASPVRAGRSAPATRPASSATGPPWRRCGASTASTTSTEPVGSGSSAAGCPTRCPSGATSR